MKHLKRDDLVDDQSDAYLAVLAKVTKPKIKGFEVLHRLLAQAITSVSSSLDMSSGELIRWGMDHGYIKEIDGYYVITTEEGKNE